MLVLTRKKNESFTIGDDIKIVVLRTGENYVKIGVKAPRDVAVVRDDVLSLPPSKGNTCDDGTSQSPGQSPTPSGSGTGSD